MCIERKNKQYTLIWKTALLRKLLFVFLESYCLGFFIRRSSPDWVGFTHLHDFSLPYGTEIQTHSHSVILGLFKIQYLWFKWCGGIFITSVFAYFPLTLRTPHPDFLGNLRRQRVSPASVVTSPVTFLLPRLSLTGTFSLLNNCLQSSRTAQLLWRLKIPIAKLL